MVKDEHVKEAGQDMAEDVTQDIAEDVAEDVLGAAIASGGTHAQYTRAPALVFGWHVKDEGAARQEPSPTPGHLALRWAIWSPRTRKVGPVRTLRDPREWFLHLRVKRPFNVRNLLLVRQAQGRFSRQLPRALVSGTRGLQPDVTARFSLRTKALHDKSQARPRAI